MTGKYTSEKFNEFFNTYSRYLSFGIALLILILSSLLLLWPQYQKLKTTGIFEHQEAQDLLAERQNYLAKLNKMRSEYQQLDWRAWQSMSKILPSENNIYLLFAQMEDFARANNLVLKNISINDNTSQKGMSTSGIPQTASDAEGGELADVSSALTKNLSEHIKKVTLTVTFDGIDSYDKFKSFLDSAENNIKILDMQSLSYSPEKNTYSVIFTTYYLKESKKENNGQ